jgi:hypothetical protein
MPFGWVWVRISLHRSESNVVYCFVRKPDGAVFSSEKTGEMNSPPFSMLGFGLAIGTLQTPKDIGVRFFAGFLPALRTGHPHLLQSKQSTRVAVVAA